MRFTRVLLLSALAIMIGVSGCGGCNSCFGTAQPGDYDATTPIATTARPATVGDAGPKAEPEATDAGDAAPAPANTEPVPRPSSVPRPKAPMPLGEFQVCGVYDGPRCEKKCDKGACRQECDGVECELSCKAGYCSQLCGASGKCAMSCAGGHCVQVCTNPDGCVKTCTGGSCE
jgi:hypothetical protein